MKNQHYEGHKFDASVNVVGDASPYSTCLNCFLPNDDAMLSWIIDTGALGHMTHFSHILVKIETLVNSIKVRLLDGRVKLIHSFRNVLLNNCFI